MDSNLSTDRKSAHQSGFTLTETLVALAASTVVLAALALTTVSLRRTFNATDSYSRAQAAQIRLIDAIAMDFRRSVGIATTISPSSKPSSNSNRDTRFAYYDSAVNILSMQDGTYDYVNNRVQNASAPSKYLTLTLPGFYQSQDSTSPLYRKQSTLISTGRSVRYGTSAGVAADVTVQYRKCYMAALSSECYVRREAGIDRVIVERQTSSTLTSPRKGTGRSWSMPGSPQFSATHAR